MGYFDDLTSIKGKKGMFAILLTATILTIFEIVLFYIIIIPDVVAQVDHNIKKIGENVSNDINEKNKAIKKKSAYHDVAVTEVTSLVFNEKNSQVLKTLSDREKNLTEHINLYTKLTGGLMLVALSIILFVTWNSIKNDVRVDKMSLDPDLNDSMFDPVLTAVITVSLLIAFQILFYFYGKQYKYPGSFGKDELIFEIIDEIKS